MMGLVLIIYGLIWHPIFGWPASWPVFPVLAPGLSAWLELALQPEVPGRDPAVMGTGRPPRDALPGEIPQVPAPPGQPERANAVKDPKRHGIQPADLDSARAPCPYGPVWVGGTMARAAEHRARAAEHRAWPKMLPVSAQPRAADASASSPGASRPAGMAPAGCRPSAPWDAGSGRPEQVPTTVHGRTAG
jgi:hypothetical protein